LFSWLKQKTVFYQSKLGGAGMEVTRESLKITTTLLGILVLVSYYYGVTRAEEPTKLWGGVPPSWQTYIVPFMFVAAIGYLAYWWITVFQMDSSTIETLNWPWADSDGNGMNRLAIAYGLILIPSAIWLESTLFHMSNDYAWTPLLVVGILSLVSLGNIMLGLLAYDAHLSGIENSWILIAGSLMLASQVIVNDLIIWSIKFPW
tara:strand:+ start:183 stop:794 length:612 start_codon:yes stop_codon:yes gene_type:complete